MIAGPPVGEPARQQSLLLICANSTPSSITLLLLLRFASPEFVWNYAWAGLILGGLCTGVIVWREITKEKR